MVGEEITADGEVMADGEAAVDERATTTTMVVAVAIMAIIPEVEAEEEEEEAIIPHPTTTIGRHVPQMPFRGDSSPPTFPVHPPWWNNWIENS